MNTDILLDQLAALPPIAWGVVALATLLALILGAVMGRLSLSGALTAAEAAADRAEADLAETRTKAEARAERVAALEAETARLTERAARIDPLEAEVRRQADHLAAARARIAELETSLAKEREAAAEKIALLEQAEARLKESFKALSNEALDQGARRWMDLAKEQFTTFQETAKFDLEKRHKAIAELVTPVRETLDRVQEHARHLESQRQEAYGQLRAQVQGLTESQGLLRGETEKLVRALRTPQAKGRWGEIQLRRVVEMAGMIGHVDFIEQAGGVSDEGRRLRPDMIIRLPTEKSLVVDAKAPTQGYLDAVEAQDEATRATALKTHARQVREHVRLLGSKQYWNALPDTPEFVVLFLPGENFFSAALEADPDLIEAGIKEKVVVATPTTLIALLRSVAYGWRQETLADNARKIAEEGRLLYDRLCVFGESFAKVGKGLSSAIDNYNKAVGSFETRLLPSARKFQDYEAAVGGKEVPEVAAVDAVPRSPAAPELALPAPDDPV